MSGSRRNYADEDSFDDDSDNYVEEEENKEDMIDPICMYVTPMTFLGSKIESSKFEASYRNNIRSNSKNYNFPDVVADSRPPKTRPPCRDSPADNCSHAGHRDFTTENNSKISKPLNKANRPSALPEKRRPQNPNCCDMVKELAESLKQIQFGNQSLSPREGRSGPSTPSDNSARKPENREFSMNVLPIPPPRRDRGARLINTGTVSPELHYRKGYSPGTQVVIDGSSFYVISQGPTTVQYEAMDTRKNERIRTWTCEICDNENYGQSVRCVICLGWKCSHCGVANAKKSPRCLHCNRWPKE